MHFHARIISDGWKFRELKLQDATADAEAVTLNYGVFVNTMLDFLIVAFADLHGRSNR